MSEHRTPYVIAVNGTKHPDEPVDYLDLTDRQLLISALHLYDTDMMELDPGKCPHIRRLCERLARPGRLWTAIEEA